MFKLRRAVTRRCREVTRRSDRGSNKRPKVEGTSNITSNRVTIPPGFLCLGVKSDTVRKCAEELESGAGYILSEDLHGLFNTSPYGGDNPKKLRRSSRISNKPLKYDSVTQHYSQDLHRDTTTGYKERSSCSASKALTRNNSKSLFRKINERCARARTAKDFTPVVDTGRRIEQFHPTTFSLNLSKEVYVDLNQHDYLEQAKLIIKEKIRDINEKLSGKLNSGTDNLEGQARSSVEGNMMDRYKFRYIPESEWVFQTPPRRQMLVPVVEECAIQPALIHASDDKNDIYELNPNIRVDLTGYTNRQNLEVDGRYMRHLASFDKEGDSVVGVNQALGFQAQGKVCYSSLLSQHFGQVTCRPSKTIQDVNDTPARVDLFPSVQETETDYTMVEEERGYRIVNKNKSGCGHGFNFNLKRNLFGEEKMFSFDQAEELGRKMFDFRPLDGK